MGHLLVKETSVNCLRILLIRRINNIRRDLRGRDANSMDQRAASPLPNYKVERCSSLGAIYTRKTSSQVKIAPDPTPATEKKYCEFFPVLAGGKGGKYSHSSRSGRCGRSFPCHNMHILLLRRRSRPRRPPRLLETSKIFGLLLCLQMRRRAAGQPHDRPAHFHRAGDLGNEEEILYNLSS